MWIGPKDAPYKMMTSWKEKNSDYEYIFWNESEILRRGMQFMCMKQINEISEINGKCDIMRWEILHKYGGVFIDADSFCIEALGDDFLDNEGFATYENESARKNLVATGTMGFVPKHRLCGDIIEWIHDSSKSEQTIKSYCAWFSVGPGLLTSFLETGNYKDFSVYPSYLFLPIHHTGIVYEGHKKVFGHQEWCTSNQSYETVNEICLPSILNRPIIEVSILISSYNTNVVYVRDCLNSIVNQRGWFNIEIVWCNDGSDDHHSNLLELELNKVLKNSRFLTIVYERTVMNMGNFKCLNKGIEKCSNEYIFKMDSDDVMVPNRIIDQYQFMIENPTIVVSGGGIKMFNELGAIRDVYHQNVVKWEDLEKEKVPSSWIMNHPTLCYKRSAVLSVGNYNELFFGESLMEDYDLELRLMKEFGAVYNIPKILVYYRVHSKQLTARNDSVKTNEMYDKIWKNL